MVFDFHSAKASPQKTPLPATVNVLQSMPATPRNSYIKRYGYRVKVKINEQSGSRFILLVTESR